MSYTIKISGKFMDALMASGVGVGQEQDLADPTGRAVHDALHAATATKRGRGYTHTVTLPSADAVDWIREYAETAAYLNRSDTVDGNDPAETRAADKVAAQCREALSA